MPLTTFSANSTARAAEVNANFALCVLTDTSRTITVTHTFSARQTMAGIDTSDTVLVTSASANALAVGLAGSTNPAFQVDASTASSATGVKVKSAAAAGGLALSVISSGTNEALTIDAKGSGTITLGGTSTGAVIVGRRLTSATHYGGTVLAATAMETFANTTLGGVLAGFGTTHDASLLNRAGSAVVGVVSNSLSVMLGGMASVNSSSGNVGIVNSSAPTGNPSGGGFLWVESGALKFRGSAGTVTTVALA